MIPKRLLNMGSWLSGVTYLKLDTGFDSINYTHITCSNNTKKSRDSRVLQCFTNHNICKIHISKDHFVEQKIIRIKREVLIYRTQYCLFFQIEPIERFSSFV